MGDLQDSSSAYDGSSNPCWPLIEIAAINDTEHQFTMQEQFGRAYHENEIMVFQAQILQFETVVRTSENSISVSRVVAIENRLENVIRINRVTSFGIYRPT